MSEDLTNLSAGRAFRKTKAAYRKDSDPGSGSHSVPNYPLFSAPRRDGNTIIHPKEITSLQTEEDAYVMYNTRVIKKVTSIIEATR